MTDTMNSTDRQMRAIAFYLPQYHPIPENDLWWSKGFTEWTNVCKARPLFRGHYQPRTPGELGFYDLRLPESRAAQARLAQQNGIEGFCYWHYWFGGGKQLLERPFDEVLASGQPDYPFCLAWANESWRGVYHGVGLRQTLIEQTYPGDADYVAHFMHLLPAFRDKRYITVDGKPLFMVYHPFDCPDTAHFISLWRTLARQHGLGDIFFVGQTYHYDIEREQLSQMGFDAINTVRLFAYEGQMRWLYRWARWKHRWLKMPFVVPYAKASRCFVSDDEKEEMIFPTIIPNWDHTPRSGTGGLVLHGETPQLFDQHLDMVDSVLASKPLEHRIAFVKSWNEWGEGNYLEPDLRFGDQFLATIKKHIYR